MDITRAEQIALDDALVAPDNRLKIGKSNFRLSSDLKSKESTLQVFWATATIHHHSILFKMNNKKHIVNLEYFREMLQICPKLPNQQFEELPFEEAILTFLRDLGHSDNVVEDEDDENTDDVDKDDEDDDADNQDDENPDDANKDDDDDEQTNSDNNGDDFVHPKLSTHDDEARQDDEVNEEESNEDIDKEVQGVNIEEEDMDEEATHEEDEANELYKDVNVNLEGRDTEMTDAPLPNCSSVSSGFVSNMLNPSPDTCIDSIFTLNTEATSLVDVPITTIAEPPLLSATTLPPPPTPLITHQQQTPVPTPPTRFLQFSALLMRTLPTRCMKPSKTVAVHLQSERLRDEAQAENADFLNKLDDNIKKIIKDQVKEQAKAQVSKILPKIEKNVNEQLKAEVLTRSSNKSKTSHAVAANLSELELKKILIDKKESNKSIHISDKQKNLYKALVDAYESDKLILDTYGDTVSFKRLRDAEDKDEEPSVGSNRGSKRRRAKKEPESTSAPNVKTSKTTGKSIEGSKSHHKSAGESAHAEEPMHTAKDLEKPAHQEFKTRTLPDAHGPVQPWLSSLARMEDPRELFNELMDTPLDFSAFSLVELEYFFEEVYKATNKLDWNNPEGQQYPHDLRNPLPLIPNSRGRRVIPFDHFINNDLEYLSGGVSSRKYTTSVTKTKAADYRHIK
ncbi:hypothetical protein Tco_1044903 [Tanacetum coccineum]|uniref:Uncharacterized protein n=1 Tax=Tanacetum coccineum TaxID=301880 RepID=A0ABQ5GR83_9ASTR